MFVQRVTGSEWAARPTLRLASAILIAALAAGCRGTATPPPTEASAPPGELQHRVLDEINTLLSSDYLYPKQLDSGWDAALSELAGRIDAGLAEEDFAAALKELVSDFPTGTVSYFTRTERIDSAIQSTATYEGIGAFVAYRSFPQPRIILLSVVAGSPAEAAGLHSHDAIYAIDGSPVTAEEGVRAIERVRGSAGTDVRLQVASPGGPRREVTVRRDNVSAVDDIRGRLLSTGAYQILVPVRVDSALLASVDDAMKTLQAQSDSPALVLDLRIAATGSGWPLKEMLALFADGEVGAFTASTGVGPLIINGQDAGGTQAVPLVVLVGPDTSGAPEVFAAAVQSSGRGLVVGSATAGRVFGYGDAILLDGSELVYVRSTFTTLSGRDLGGTGVVPNYVIQADWDEVTDTQDPVLVAALGLLLP